MATRRFLISSLVLGLCGVSVLSADVFVSIDCGSSSSYRDQNGIDWTGDDNKYVQTGVSRSVQSSNSLSHVMDTLRVFTTRKKNCYYIDSVRRGRVLVRATFYYGNYDGKSSPPTFDLHLDGNHWDSVWTSSSIAYYYEVIHVMKKDSISVCVAQIHPGEFPFISALEIRGLESYMYRHIDARYPLFTWRRFAFGSNSTIWYPEDFYDRLWSPYPYNINGSIKVFSDARFSELVISSDRPPPAVLKNAITATSPNSSIELFVALPTTFEIPLYINWYFSEVTRLKPNETRSFRIFMDQSLSDTILPPYDNCTEIYASNLTASSNITFSLVPTNDSTLPPLINAMEVFRIGDELTDGTNMKDVQGLASLQKAFDVLQGWSADPCLPASYTWDWIECNDNPTPRVTALFLGSFGLSGLLPDFSSLDALRTIDLHNNSLQGPIPDFLGTLPNLKTLNLANNQFNGTIPASLSTKKGLTLLVTGNPGLCTSTTSCSAVQTPPVSSSVRKKTKNIQIGIIISSIVIFQLRKNLMG